MRSNAEGARQRPRKRGNLRNKTETCQPPNPPHRRMRSIIRFFAHALEKWKSGKVEKWKGSREARRPRLGLNACYGRVWGGRRCTAWRSSPTRSRGTRDPTKARARERGEWRRCFQIVLNSHRRFLHALHVLRGQQESTRATRPARAESISDRSSRPLAFGSTSPSRHWFVRERVEEFSCDRRKA